MILLATEVWKSHGGVQRYMRMIVRMLEESGRPFHIVSLLDDEASRPPELQSRAAVCAGSKLAFLRHTMRLAAEHKRDAAIAGHPGLLPVVWALRRLRLCSAYAVVLHGIEAWKRLSPVHRLAARDAHTIVATTQYTAREFCFFNRVDFSRCVVIPLAAERVHGGPRREPPQGEVRLLTVSRLSTADQYKGVDSVFKAVRLGIDTGLRVSLDVAGDGDDLDRLRRLSHQLGLDQAVRFHGAVSEEKLSELYSSAHIFAMPSKKEGFGIVFLEAMAAGLPCIGGNHGGTPEVIEHGVSGFLVEYGDAEQIWQYVQALADSPSLYQAVSEGARGRALHVLTFENMSAAWRSIFASLPARGGGSSQPAGASSSFTKETYPCAELRER